MQLEETTMRKLLLLLSVVLLFGYRFVPGAAALSQEGSSGPNAGKGSGQVPPHVKEIYQLDCAICHGATGDGKTDLAKDMNLTLVDWTDPKTLEGKSDQELFDIIRKGKDKMPPEDAARAKNDDVKALIVYIRSLSKNPATPAHTTPAPASTTSSPSSTQ